MSSFAQAPPTEMGPGTLGTLMATRAGATVHVKVLDETEKPLKQQALIRITSKANGKVFFQTTRGAEASFPALPIGEYLIEVGSAGYLGMHQRLFVTDASNDFTETATLVRDPAAVDLTLKNAGQLPAKVRKEVEKGLQALVLSNFVDARKHLESANREYASSSSINFLLGYLAVQQKDQEHALAYLTTATKLDPKNVQAQNLLGQVYFIRGEYAHAAEAEEVVVANSSESLVARKVLANSYLKLRQYDKAQEQAKWIVDHGGSEGASALLVLGQAQAGLQKNEEAIQSLTAYLKEGHPGAVAPQIREIIAQLQQDVAQGGTGSRRNSAIADPELTAESEAASGAAGMPSDIDTQKPSIVAGVACPANLLQVTANPTRELVDSITRFSAVEHMVHESLSSQGTPRNRDTRQYNYVVNISEPAPGALRIEEYRDSGDLDMPEKITTTGLPVLAIAFHPMFREDFDMRCEGLGEWNGQPAWLVHFRQIDGRPIRLRSYVVNKTLYPVPLKGRAWVAADNFQIVHLETDLVHSVPEIRLFTEHTSVSYGPVQFAKSGTDLWLPKSAELYVHFGSRRFHRSENFDHFMLFATDAVETPKVPTADLSRGSTENHGASVPQ